MTAPAPAPARTPVPVRAIAATIGMVLLTVIAILIVTRVERVLVWLLISVFLTTALWPLVGLAQHRAKLNRSLSVLLVFMLAAVVLAGIIALFVTPLVTQGRDFFQQLPTYVDQARAGKGPVGELITRFNIDGLVARNQARIREGASGLGGGAAHFLGVVANTLAGVASIVVLTFLMLLEGPKLLDGTLNALDPTRRNRVERVGRDCAHAVTGYVAGNLVISVICGLLTFIVLEVLGVPFAGVVAVFVAIADLIPLVGATIGMVAAAAVAFLESVTAGIVTVVFFLIYQQLENHLLQPVILARTVKIDPLAVLVAILVGVELAGILGALLGIPIAGIIQVLVRDFYDHRRGVVKATPTTGEDEVPVDGHGSGRGADDPYPAERTTGGSVRERGEKILHGGVTES